jgi:ATP-binding cassette subfamily C protein
VGIGSGIALVLHFLVQMAKRAAVRETSRTRELLAFLTDALNSIKPLKAMARQEHFAQLFERKNQDLNKSLQRQIYYGEARRNLEEVLTIVSLAVAFFVAVRFYGYSLSEVLVIGLFLAQTMRNIGKMQDALQKALVVESPYRALQGLIADAETAAEHSLGTRTPSFEQGCRFEAVTFAFGDKGVLDDVSLFIPARCRTVLIGPSGGGKTTLLDLLIGLYRPAAGRILIDGVLLEELELKQWRRMIGYVPQDLILYHDSIYANVTLGNPGLGEADVREALEAAGAWPFVEELPGGMHTTVGEKGFKFSGGQRQRIALARALAARPKLLILDEVTSALDPKTEQDLCDRLQALGREMAILAITHRPAFLAIADRVLVVRNGTVEEVRGDSLPQPDALTGSF